jgi:signal transduction histidine kinase
MSSSDSHERLLAAIRPVPVEERLIREEERVRALQEIAEAVLSTHNLNDLLKLILAKITRLMDADRATLFLVDEETGELWSKLVQGDEIVEIRLQIGEGIAGAVAQSGRSMVLRDAYKDPRFLRAVDAQTGYRTRSVLCVPMHDPQKNIIGVIQVLNKIHGYFTMDDEKLLTTFAAHAAISIETSKLYTSIVGKNIELLEAHTALEEKIRELDVLYEVELKMSAAEDLDEILRVVVARTAEAIEAKAAILALSDEAGNIHFGAVYGVNGAGFSHLTLERGHGMIGRSIETGKVFLTQRLLQDPIHDARVSTALGFIPRSSMVVPLHGDRVLGALQLFDKRAERGFDEEDEKIAVLLAGRAAQVISAHRAREERTNASRLEAIGRTLSGIVHDFKTPMTLVSGYAQLAATEPNSELRQQHAQSIQKQLGFLDGMVRELLGFARGEKQLLIRKVLMNVFLAETEHLLRSMVENTNITLTFMSEYKGPARFDEIKITRAITNVVRNAIQAMPTGGALCFTAKRIRDELLFIISDTGGGIPSAIEGRVFDSFVTHGKRGGTGLGLSIVKKALDDHGGRVDYISNPGQGTTFTFTLPVEATEIQHIERATELTAE